MPSWFIGTIKYQEVDNSANVNTKEHSSEAPRVKTVTETRLIDAVSHTDAEARLTAAIADNTPDFEVVSIRPKRLADVFEFPKGERWFQARTYYMTEDDKGRTKKVTQSQLVNAETFAQALANITERNSSMLVPVMITDLNETKIIEILKHDAK